MTELTRYVVYITSSAKPNITVSPPKSYVTTKGEAIQLQCFADGTPKPEIIWVKRKGGRAVIGTDFILESALPEDTGNWTCRASNVLGTDTANVEIIVASKSILTHIFSGPIIHFIWKFLVLFSSSRFFSHFFL